MPDGEFLRPRLHLAPITPGAPPRPVTLDEAARLLTRLDPETRREFGLEDDDARSFDTPRRADGPPTIDLVAEVVAINSR